MMTKTILINRKTPIALRDVAVIEPVTLKDIQAMAARYEAVEDDFSAFNSIMRMVDGTTRLATQTLDEIAKLCERRVLNMSPKPLGKEQARPAQLVPIDAIRYLESLDREDRAAMRQSYPDADPKRLDDKRSRIVYRAVDPRSGNGAFQKTFAADLKRDLEHVQA